MTSPRSTGSTFARRTRWSHPSLRSELMVAEQRFRRLKAPELIEDVYLGAQYVDAIVSETTAEKVAA